MKNMKITLSALALSLSVLAGCAAAEENKLYDKGLEAAAQIKEMTESESYLQFMSGSQMITDHLKDAGAKDPQSPKAVYRITIEEALKVFGLDEIEGFSDSLKDMLRDRCYSAVAQQINAMGGAELIAASSVCTTSKSFRDEAFHGNVIYLYVYEDAAPVMVSFSEEEDQTVCASASLILYDGFKFGIPEEIKTFFDDIPVEVEEITR